MSRTFALLRPDCVARGLTGHVLTVVLNSGFGLARLEMFCPPPPADSRRGGYEDRVAAHYAEHAGRDYFQDLFAFMLTGPSVAMVLHYDGDAVARFRELMGSYRPEHFGDQRTIRGRYMVKGDPAYMNLVHGADSAEAAKREAELWFGPGVIV